MVGLAFPLRRSIVASLVACFTFGLSACGEEASDGGVIRDESSATITIGDEFVTTTTVKLRSGPGVEHAVVQTLDKGATVVAVNRTTTSGDFYNVRFGTREGWVHGAYLTKKTGGGTSPAPTPTPPAPTPATTSTSEPPTTCVERRLSFSADAFPTVPTGAFVWGGNATDGESFIDPPYAPAFLSRAAQAHQRGVEVFAYLEGPCGNTGGVDDGEVKRCAAIHNAYNARFAPSTPSTSQARWKPYTIKQLTTSGAHGVDYCEIDNLENNVTISLNPLLVEIKGLFDTGKIHCRLVLKNVSVNALDSIRKNVAPTPAAANFIAPFHIYEADDTSEKAGLDAAMTRLKGAGAVTIISTDTNAYGSAFTKDKFRTCQ